MARFWLVVAIFNAYDSKPERRLLPGSKGDWDKGIEGREMGGSIGLTWCFVYVWLIGIVSFAAISLSWDVCFESCFAGLPSIKGVFGRIYPVSYAPESS